MLLKIWQRDVEDVDATQRPPHAQNCRTRPNYKQFSVKKISILSSAAVNFT